LLGYAIGAGPVVGLALYDLVTRFAAAERWFYFYPREEFVYVEVDVVVATLH
jgi:hypothetical protein